MERVIRGVLCLIFIIILIIIFPQVLSMNASADPDMAIQVSSISALFRFFFYAICGLLAIGLIFVGDTFING